MTLAEKLARAVERAEHDATYWKDIAITDFTRDLHTRMEGISQSELARRMKTSRPHITKLLAGGNFTLLTMVRLAMALDSVVRVRLEGREVREAQRHAGTVARLGQGSVVDFAGHLEARVPPEPVNTSSSAETYNAVSNWGR